MLNHLKIVNHLLRLQGMCFLLFEVIDFAIFTIQNLSVMVGRLHLPSTCFAIEFVKLKLWRDLGQ